MIGGTKGEELVLSSTTVIYNSTKTLRNGLLGVSGTDIPISHLRRFIKPHKLGPNGYAFLMTKNGYVIIHPGLKLYAGEQLTKTYRSMSINRLENLINR